MSGIYVEVCAPGADIQTLWAELVQRAPANVFMNPAVLNAVHAAQFARVHMLLAWRNSAGAKQLVGIWALQEKRVAPGWPVLLIGPPFNYAFVSNPVIDQSFTDDVIAAFLDAVAKHPSLPKLIRLRYLDASSESGEALLQTSASGTAQAMKLSERQRPFASRELNLKRSGSTRKKLRQDWNRLSALGPVELVNDRDQSAVRDAFETFLSMEANSWKGSRGTALLSSDRDAAFARSLIANLAAQRSATVALLRVSGRPIAAQVLLYSGRTAYTWKTSFDAEYARYSPGALLIEKLTEILFSSSEIDAIESCSPEGSFMEQLWSGRRTTVDLLVEMRARKSLSFNAVAMGEQAFSKLRVVRNKFHVMGAAARANARLIAAPAAMGKPAATGEKKRSINLRRAASAVMSKFTSFFGC
jgi:CelD/BcsL family acetyltransferase involved in cellulose biosynthesis